MPSPQPPCRCPPFLAHLALHFAYAMFWYKSYKVGSYQLGRILPIRYKSYKVGFDALNCIRLTSPSLAKGIIKYGSLLPGKHSTDANQRMGVWGGRSKDGER